MDNSLEYDDFLDVFKELDGCTLGKSDIKLFSLKINANNFNYDYIACLSLEGYSICLISFLRSVVLYRRRSMNCVMGSCSSLSDGSV